MSKKVGQSGLTPEEFKWPFKILISSIYILAKNDNKNLSTTFLE